MSAGAARAELGALADPARARALAAYFRTGPGGYGEGDVFAGVRVPDVRAVAARHRDLTDADLADLLADPVHEHRLLALVVLDDLARAAARRRDAAGRERLARFYLAHLDGVDNWDLVDVSAPHVLGGWWAATTDAPVPTAPGAGEAGEQFSELVRSPSLWRRRVAVMATWAFTRDGRPGWTLDACERLVGDPHDLVHKAMGWMLREVAKREPERTLAFLDAHAGELARVTVRYAVERLPGPVRRVYVPPR